MSKQSNDKKVLKPRLQTITIHHPIKMIKNAVINIWFMPNGDIVLGGCGWYEYYDYEKKKTD